MGIYLDISTFSPLKPRYIYAFPSVVKLNGAVIQQRPNPRSASLRYGRNNKNPWKALNPTFSDSSMGQASKGCPGAARLNWRGVQCVYPPPALIGLTLSSMSWIFKYKAFLISVLLLVLGFFLTNAFIPPFFVQFGEHFYSGTDLTNGGWTWCDPPDDFYNCEPTRESFVAAVARDPNIGNWLPIRPEFIRLDDSYGN